MGMIRMRIIHQQILTNNQMRNQHVIFFAGPLATRSSLTPLSSLQDGGPRRISFQLPLGATSVLIIDALFIVLFSSSVLLVHGSAWITLSFLVTFFFLSTFTLHMLTPRNLWSRRQLRRGWAAATVGLVDLREKALVMLLNLVFTKGDYEGSTLSILGRNPLGAETREVPIVAGTAAFRMATGYIITTTYFKDPARVRNVYEYNAVVFHMDRAALLSRQ